MRNLSTVFSHSEALTIPPFPVTICPLTTPAADCLTSYLNEVPLAMLGDVGAAVAGAKITFVAQALTETNLYLTNLKLTGGPAGAYIEHPLFVSRPAAGGEPVPDQIDLTTTNQSGIYLAPDPASNTNHPQKFAAGQFTSNFKTPVDLWVQAEKIAPQGAP